MRDKPRGHDAGRVLVLDIETAVPDLGPAETGFPKWTGHRPVVASMLSIVQLNRDRWQFDLASHAMCETDPVRFFDALEEALASHRTIVTANGRGFDIPSLGLNAMRHKHFAVPALSQLVHENRYGAKHADVLDLFANFGAAPKPSLADLCDALAIPVKQEAHGSEVADLLASGDLDTVQRYCETDVIATCLVWLHWLALRDADADRFDTPLAALADWIEVGGAKHLQPYARCVPALIARKRAPLHAVTRMIEDARWRVNEEAEANRPRTVLHF